MAPDGRMFRTSGGKGELHDLKQGLNANTMKERKTALKRTVAAMTIGKDVSSLFTDIVKNTAGDLSMKKLVYLYIINYAHANPNLSILIVNTFIKDSTDYNPLIRALAIRTMALIPLENIMEYLCDPLHAALKDSDPYVRKTAAVSVAKLYDTNPDMAIEEGFIDELQQLLNDRNPVAVANAVAALSEIAQSSNSPDLLNLNSSTVSKFLSALSECTEWGQVFILDAISSYVPSDTTETDPMIERIIPRLQHSNPAVVLASVKIIVNLMPLVDSSAKREFLVQKMSAPLVTLLTGSPELQFVALRNLRLLIREYPSLLSNDIKVLFVSYADPLYVKIEKLGTMVQLTDESNANTVLTELMEYTTEVDITFAQKAVASIGCIAVSVPAVSGVCVESLSGLLGRGVAHLTEQVAIVLKDILREYPRQFRDIVEQLYQASEYVEDPPAKAALVWIIGEHADMIPESISLLEIVAEKIDEEMASVQLQILTACVKAYLSCGEAAYSTTDKVLKYATEESENVDIRDRGFVYMRLVSASAASTRSVLLSNKQNIPNNKSNIPKELQEELLRSLSTISSVYHKPTRFFQGPRKKVISSIPLGETAEEDLLELDHEIEEPVDNTPRLALTDGSEKTSQPVGDALLNDILGISEPPQHGTNAALPLAAAADAGDNLLGNLSIGSLSIPATTASSAGAVANLSSSKREWLSAERGHGLGVNGCFARDDNGKLIIEMDLINTAKTPMNGFAITFNKNMFALSGEAGMLISQPLAPSSSVSCRVRVQFGKEPDANKGLVIQTAIKFSPGGVVYFAIDASDWMTLLFYKTKGRLSKSTYLSTWKNVPDVKEVRTSIGLCSHAVSSMEWISKRLEREGVFVVAKRSSAKPCLMYLSAVMVGPLKPVFMAELTMPTSGNLAILASRCTISSEAGYNALVKFNERCGQLLG